MNAKTVRIDGGWFGMLTLLFIAFKLLGVISWSWWWVLSPLWLPAAIALAILLPVALIIFFAAVFS